MQYEQLKHGQEIEMCHHFNSLGGDYSWRKGTVDVRKGGKYFNLEGSKIHLLILPHRMDEIREIAK